MQKFFIFGNLNLWILQMQYIYRGRSFTQSYRAMYRLKIQQKHQKIKLKLPKLLI